MIGTSINLNYRLKIFLLLLTIPPSQFMIILSPKLQTKYFLDFRKFLINSTESEIMLNLWQLGHLLHEMMGLITTGKSVTLL